MKIKTKFRSAVGALIAVCIAASCSTPKNVAYFQDSDNLKIYEILTANEGVIKVQPHDKLTIVVSCKDPALAQIFNKPVFSNTHVQRSSPNGVSYREYNVGYSDGITGFTVSEEGTIDYPVLGELKVAGMTREELEGFIKGELMGRGLIKDPVVTVEFLNFGFSMLGDVARPGRYDLNVDELTIVEAISHAGDLSIQGQRDKIKVLRKDGDKLQTFIVDLTDTEKLVKSPAYYIKQGDIIYVEPNDIRKRQTIANGNSVTNISFWISIASLLTSAAILFKK